MTSTMFSAHSSNHSFNESRYNGASANFTPLAIEIASGKMYGFRPSSDRLATRTMKASMTGKLPPCNQTCCHLPHQKPVVRLHRWIFLMTSKQHGSGKVLQFCLTLFFEKDPHPFGSMNNGSIVIRAMSSRVGTPPKQQ